MTPRDPNQLEDIGEIIILLNVPGATRVEDSDTYYPSAIFNEVGDVVAETTIIEVHGTEVEQIDSGNAHILRSPHYKTLGLCQDFGALIVDNKGQITRFAFADGASLGVGSADLANLLVLKFLETDRTDLVALIKDMDRALAQYRIPINVEDRIDDYCRHRDSLNMAWQMKLYADRCLWAASTIIGGVIENKRLRGIIVGDGGVLVISKKLEIKFIKMTESQPVPKQLIAGSSVKRIQETDIESFEVELEEGDMVLGITDGLLKVDKPGQNIDRFKQRVLELLQEGKTLKEVVRMLFIEADNKDDKLILDFSV